MTARAAAILFLAASCAAAAEPLHDRLPNDLLHASVYQLPNGLTVYLSPYHQEPRISAWIVVRAGAKDDPPESTGMAHYLEHMFFKGTTRLGTIDYEKERPHLERILQLYEDHFHATDPAERSRLYKEIDAENKEASRYASPNEIARAYRQMGFRGLNAFTSEDQTIYVCDLPANRAEAWAKLESERFAHPVFRLFQSELEAVYEEKNRSLDNPERIVQEARRRALYGPHPYGRMVLGSIAHLKNPSLKRMYEFYAKNYRPSNMALVLSGDFEREKMLALLTKYFGAWKNEPAPEPKHFERPAFSEPARVSVDYVSEEQVQISWPLPPIRDPDEDAIEVMDMLMDNSASGLINLRLSQAQKVKAAGSYPDAKNDGSEWVLWAIPKKGQSLEEAESLLMETVSALKAGDFSEDDMKALVTNYEVSQKTQFETNEGRVSKMAFSFAQRRPWPEAVADLDRLRKVRKEDVLRVAEKYLGDGRVVVYRRNAAAKISNINKPGFGKVDIDPARQSEFFKEIVNTPSPELEPRWLRAGRDYQVADLPAGPLYSARNTVNDVFTVTLNFERGSRQERDLCAAIDLLGLSGAGELSAEDFKKKIYKLGTSISYGCSEQGSSVQVTGLESHLEESLALMEKRFDAPNVSTDALKKLVEVSLGAHQDNKKNPGAIYRALSEWAQRGPESGVLAELTDAEWRALRLDDLKSLMKHALDFKRRAAYVGDRDPAEVGRLLSAGRSLFIPPPARVPLRYVHPEGPRVLVTPRAMVQARIGFFAADGTVDLEHIADYSFYSAYMGGGMSAVIFQEVREARSLAYAASGGYDYGGHKDDDNRVWADLGCQADKAGEAAELMSRLIAEPPLSEKRFAETKKAIEENYRGAPIFFRSIPGTVISWSDLGFASDPRPERFARTLSYTMADLEAFSRRFQNLPLTLYILGPAERIGLDKLKSLGEVEQKPVDSLFPY